MTLVRFGARDTEAVEEAKSFAEINGCLMYVNPAPPMTDYKCIVIFYRFLGVPSKDVAMDVKLAMHPRLELLKD
jgi:hypothetical protein